MRMISTLAWLALVPAAYSANLSFDAVSQFNQTGPTQTPGAMWTYGSEPTLNGTFTLLPTFQPPISIPAYSPPGSQLDGWELNVLDPGVAYNLSGGTVTVQSSPVNLIFPNTELSLIPGSSQSGAPPDIVVRFTDPTGNNGAYNIAGVFMDLQESSANVFVYINGVPEFSGIFSGGSPYQGSRTFALSNVVITPGATVDFIVQPLGATNFGDAVGLSAALTPVPEPGTIVVIAGLAGLIRMRRPSRA
jgi:hypothetical protein